MTASRIWLVALVASCLLAQAPAAGAQSRLPIVDAHMHYNQEAWEEIPPKQVLAAMEQAGVARALLSSTPDEGTLKLGSTDPRRFALELRPYRGGIDGHNWFADEETSAYIAQRLEKTAYVGIGEVHLQRPEDVTPAVVAIAKLAHAKGLFLHVHAGAAPVAELLKAVPKLKVVWAHAGMSTPPQEVGRLMDAHPTVWVELSFRAGDIAPGGEELDAPWEVLLIRHADRFMVGSDTYANGRWPQYVEIIEEHRRWLAKLPPGVASAIAWRNAVGLFGDGGLLELAK
jgi:hypothetical protein